jgi:hypothetical protein
MAPAVVHAVLSHEEAVLLERLRGVPPGPLRARLVRLLLDLIGFVREPSCAAAQADGVPCDSAHSSCERCRNVATVIADIDEALGGVLGWRPGGDDEAGAAGDLAQPSTRPPFGVGPT